MHAVRGYETKASEIIDAMRSGYPRFVLNRFVKQLTAHYAQQRGCAAAASGAPSPDANAAPRRLWLTSSAPMAAALQAELAATASGAPATQGAQAADTAPAQTTRTPNIELHDFDGIAGLSHPDNPALAQRAHVFLQNTGGFLSSRAAEDRLHALGLAPAPQHEAARPHAEALAHIRRALAPLFAGCAPTTLLPASCGMNALYASFCALAERQAARGRRTWVQLGWLYLDTIALLKRHAQQQAQPGDYIYLPDVCDLAALETLFARRGAEIAGIVIEAPTNPLIQTPDLAAIYTLARRHGAAVIADPSVASVYSVDVLPHADVVATSLTKYTASEGDLVAGLVVVNPQHPEADSLRRDIAARLEPVYPRDLARLACQIDDTRAVLAQIQRSVPIVAAWLQAHPAVKEVAWAHSPKTRANYEKIARAPGAVGGLISFALHAPIEKFYDAVPLPKGASFGMKTTLLCPFIYLAHYDLVTSEAGRSELAASGIAPELLRLSVGTEPVEEILAALDIGLRQPGNG
ncbi:hypothetical protein AXK11_06610 [Cephaloticoccus primus]|uniref:Cystathionine gamma-synthase n=1 Tax=Cephaloticoccus primus TaxID=1548207 RepID=A0A139SLM2_9BACT|nr:PLP-dependent transferase [Cephaloticoccus primus]KXU35446.1 hypothetical protein AXK11_06610 [Cephaloticoccus primus]